LDIYNHAMELPITVMQCKLLLLAPELHTQVANATIKQWHIPHETAQVMIKEINECKEEQEHAHSSHTCWLHLPRLPAHITPKT
jgi:hypothetical protein